MDPRLEGGGGGGGGGGHQVCANGTNIESKSSFTMRGPCRTFSCKLPVLCNYTQLKITGADPGGGGGGGGG